MLFGNHLGEFDKLKYICRVLTILLIVSFLGNLTTGFLTYSLARSKRTIIVPSTISASLEVSDVEGDADYIRQMSIYAVGLLYQYTPFNAAARFQEFLFNFIPSQHVNYLRAQLQKQLKEIQRTKIAETIHIDNVFFEKKNTVLLTGVLTRYSIGEQIGNEKIYIDLEYRFINGGFKIEVIRNITAQEYNLRARNYTDQQRKRAKRADERNDRVIEQHEKENPKPLDVGPDAQNASELFRSAPEFSGSNSSSPGDPDDSSEEFDRVRGTELFGEILDESEEQQ